MAGGMPRRRHEADDVPVPQGASMEPAESGRKEGPPAPEDRLDVDAPRYGQVGAAALDAPPELQPPSGLDPERSPCRHPVKARPAYGDPGGLRKLEVGPGERDLERRRILGIADEEVCHPERERVRCAADRNAFRKVPPPPEVLDGRQHAGSYDPYFHDSNSDADMALKRTRSPGLRSAAGWLSGRKRAT